MSPKVNSVMGLRPGKGIARQYKNAKICRAVHASTGLANFSLASMTALNHSLLPTLMIAFFTFRSIRQVEIIQNEMSKLKPRYDEIVKKAKRVFNNKK